MIDTVRLKADGVGLDAREMIANGWQEHVFTERNANGVPVCRTRLEMKREHESPHYMMYIPMWETLVVEASLPRILWGHNVRLLAPRDVPLALEQLTERVVAHTGQPVPTCLEWQVKRVDYCFNWQVGSLASAYIDVFSQRHLKYLRTVLDNGTVSFKSDRRIVRIYDKDRESHRDDARGLLRFEVEVRRPKEEALRLDGMGSTRAEKLLQWPVARAVLQRHLDELGVGLSMDADKCAFDRLRILYGYSKAERLLGYLHLTRLYGSELRGIVDDRKKTCQRDKDLRNAGVFLGLPGMKLPALTLPENFDGEAGVLVS